MTILNVIEYKEEGVAIIEDTSGKYLVTESDPEMISLPPEPSFFPSFNGLERDRLLT